MAPSPSGSEWATVDYQSEYQSSDVWFTVNPENDAYHYSELGQYAFGPALGANPPLPEYEHVDEAGGYGTHPGGGGHCHFEYPTADSMRTTSDAEASATRSGSKTYIPIGTHQIDTRAFSTALDERQQFNSIPPALEQYVHDLQSHEELAVRCSGDPPIASGKRSKGDSHGKRAHRADSDNGSRVSRSSRGAEHHNANRGDKHERSI